MEFPSDAQVAWCFQCLGADGGVIGECHFTCDEAESESRPYRFYKYADVGFCVLPPPEQESEGQLVPDDLQALRVLPETHGLLQGTRVAWAGFAGQVEAFLKRSQLCYFEGVVSASYVEGDHGLCVVDGHNALGVSGGPVWHWPESSMGIEVAGIVAGYGTGERDMPGFCVFEAINPVVTFVKSQYRGQKGDARSAEEE